MTVVSASTLRARPDDEAPVVRALPVRMTIWPTASAATCEPLRLTQQPQHRSGSGPPIAYRHEHRVAGNRLEAFLAAKTTLRR